MNLLSKFIKKYIIRNLILFWGIALLLYFLFRWIDGGQFKLNIFFPILFGQLADFYILFQSIAKLKKMGVNLNKAENLTTKIQRDFYLDLNPEEILELLKNGKWKFKIYTKQYMDAIHTVEMKHYLMMGEQSIKILFRKEGTKSHVVLYCEKKNKSKFQSIPYYWAQYIPYFEFFEKVLRDADQQKKDSN